MKENFVCLKLRLNNNMIYVLKSFEENFPNFNLALKNSYMYKSDKKNLKVQHSFFFIKRPYFMFYLRKSESILSNI